MEIVWSRLAKETFAELLQFVEEHFNGNVARRVADSIVEYADLLGSFPRAGYVDEQF